MNKQAQGMISYLLSHPDELLMKKPFTRGGSVTRNGDYSNGDEVYLACKRTAVLPRVTKYIVTQEQFLKELDPQSHKIMVDENIPSICVKVSEGGYRDLENLRMPLGFQERIRQKQTLTMCGNPCELPLRNADPTDKDKRNVAYIRSKWVDRNMDGMRTKAVYAQKGMGDAGLLFYFDRNGQIKSRLLTYEDGYVIISHNDMNGDRLLECVYYQDETGKYYIDCYDDTYMYRMTNSAGMWSVVLNDKHGFPECPLVTKRGNPAHNSVQGLIEAYEILYNIFLVIQKRHGWGILYIRGNFDESVKKLAGSIILNDKSIEGNGSAEFKTPPTPTGFLDTLQSIYEQIQIQSSTTFILPKDVKSSGDISALAIMLTQELDIEGATNDIIEWQNFLNKMLRLFKYGLAVELVNSGENKNAITEFTRLDMSCKCKIWRPFSESEYNQMLATLVGAGILSRKTGIERNTVAMPDEERRIDIEDKAKEVKSIQIQQASTDIVDTNIRPTPTKA